MKKIRSEYDCTSVNMSKMPFLIVQVPRYKLLSWWLLIVVLCKHIKVQSCKRTRTSENLNDSKHEKHLTYTLNMYMEKYQSRKNFLGSTSWNGKATVCTCVTSRQSFAEVLSRLLAANSIIRS